MKRERKKTKPVIGQDCGQSHAINKWFEKAMGETFGWLNSDDWYLPVAPMEFTEREVRNVSYR